MEKENKNDKKGSDYKKFATPRIIGGIAIAVIILWALSIFFGPTKEEMTGETAAVSHESAKPASVSHSDDHADKSEDTHASAKEHKDASSETTSHAVDHENGHEAPAKTGSEEHATSSSTGHEAKDQSHNVEKHDQAAEKHVAETTQGTDAHGTQEDETSTASHQADSHGQQAESAEKTDTHKDVEGHPLPDSVHGLAHKPQPKGVAFVEAAIKPLKYELEERWWGWRANDLINVTDNVESFQMGVLEVTRRTTVALAERISRTGTTDAYDENLEQAMNWFMVKASSYWFPSAESKYKDGLEELETYLEKLKRGAATFYTRTDNLIPLLASFEDLLGSCDENLVKHANEDGTPVSFFVVDNYFYYTQGVASSMAVILEAVHHDFLLTLESRHGTELLHHAIVSCQEAAELDPWIVLDRDLSSVFANHRANMAAPISHARFYLGQLIKTLST